MKNIVRASLCLVLTAGPLAPARADSAGSTPFDFLALDANARAVALAGAYTALATDSNALLYNPAGLAAGDFHEATFMHNEYVEGVRQEYMGYSSGRGWGLNLNYLSFGAVPHTTLSQPGGTLGTTGLNDLALGAGYGLWLTDSLSVGAGLKYIRESIDDVSAWGYAADLGAFYKVGGVPGLVLASSVQNLGPTVRFHTARESLPTTLRWGGAYHFTAAGQNHTTTADITKTVYDRLRFGLGFESVVFESLALRLGFTDRNDAGIGYALGLGWRQRRWSMDYAFAPMGALGDGHRLSLSYRWGEPKR